MTRSENNNQVVEYISELVKHARKAQAEIEFVTQEEADLMCTRVAWSGVRPDFAKSYTDFCAKETGMGYGPHKYTKLMTKVKGTLRDMKGERSVGVVAHDKEKGIIKIAKPVGVIGALMPVTNGEATPFVKALAALKTRNAIIMAPHPKAQQTNNMAVAQIRSVLKKHGWPEDLVIGVESISLEKSQELIKQVDLILATGGSPMVKAAYSSGKPAYGVGAGNAMIIVDDTANLKEAADKIMRSKTFDHATSCSTENALAIQDSIYPQMLKELELVGGYLCNAEEKEKLQRATWDEKGMLNRAIVAQPANKIASIAGLNLPNDKSFFMVEETGIGKNFPFSGEKLSVTATVYRWSDFAEAVDLVNRISSYSGPGHSCGIHSANDMHIRLLGMNARVSRIMVNQPQCLGNSGAWTNGMPMTMTLGCGTWGGNASSSNITWKELLNYTWLSYPIPSVQPNDEDLFGNIMHEN